MAQAEHVPADFVSIFRQRFAPLFGRKIARQRAEQYLGGLLGGRAERRNVTSLADTVDGATARALGWLLNKSPWPTRPIVDALQAYVGQSFDTSDGLFTLNLDSFIKRGDNAVGVDKQYVHHLGRTANCQIGVFLAYGSEQASALVDAAVYMPHTWIDDASRREKAGVPESLEYQPRSALALALLQRAREAGHLPGQWVTSWHGEGFEPDLRERLAADGWRYLLPVGAAATYFEAPDAAEARAVSDLAGVHVDGTLQVRRVWEASEKADRQASWLLSCTDPLSGEPVAFVSNAPEDATPEVFQRVLAAHWETARMLAARCAGVSLDVYRVRGWDGWHRHVALALVASAFRACLPAPSSAAEDLPAPMIEAVPALLDADHDVPSTPVSATAATVPSPLLDARAPADAAPAAPVPVIPPSIEEMAVSIEDPAPDAVEASPALPPLAPVSYRLAVDISASEWRAVRAFQVWLVADEAGTIIESSPSKAEIEREEVGSRVDVRFESSRSLEQLMTALEDVPEISVIELVADGAAAEPAPPSAASAQLEPAIYRLQVSIQETDWRAVRAFQVWQVADDAGTVISCSPSKTEIEHQEVGSQMSVRFESTDSLEQILAALDEVPEITVAELVVDDEVSAAEAPVVAAVADAFIAADEDAEDLGDADALLSALEAELSARTTAREAGLMPAFEGPVEVVGNAVIEASIVLEETRELVGAGSSNGANGQKNGHANGANGNGAGAALLDNLAKPTPPSVPPAEAPVRPAAEEQPAPAAPVPAEAADRGKDVPAERARPDEEQMVVLDVGDESYGIPVKQVREIIRVPPITRVPNGPAFLEGVINLRGQVIPVMDLRKHLGIPS
ncbi:MAG: transposase, partial [Chloroflexota bacterium]